MMREIILATQNQGKVKEMRELLQGLSYTVRTAKEAGFNEDIEETGDSFAENACIKAEAIAAALGCWALADDSGLVVDALNGAPGVHSARYAGADSDDARNNEKLLREMAEVSPAERTARFVSVVALARPGEENLCFEGVCEGEVLEAPRGEGGFGYDPLFLPSGETQSYAELSAQGKNRLSHRGKAMRLLKAYLLTMEGKGC